MGAEVEDGGKGAARSPEHKEKAFNHLPTAHREFSCQTPGPSDSVSFNVSH